MWTNSNSGTKSKETKCTGFYLNLNLMFEVNKIGLKLLTELKKLHYKHEFVLVDKVQ